MIGINGEFEFPVFVYRFAAEDLGTGCELKRGSGEGDKENG